MKNMRSTEASRSTISVQQCAPEVIQLATNYASDYLDYVENLPFDLQRSVTKLREVDQKCREYVKETESLYDSFMKENDGNMNDRRRSLLLQIRRLFGLCKELGDEKIAIAQSISEAIEIRNKQLEHGCKRFRYAYEPNCKNDHASKKERDMKLDSAKGTKRSRRQRNNHSIDNNDKIHHQYKELEKAAKASYYEDNIEPPAKIIASASPDDSSPIAIPTPALTRAAQRDEDKRLSSKSTKLKKEEKYENSKDDETTAVLSSSTKVSNSSSTIVSSSTTSTSSVTSTPSSTKQSKNSTISAASTPSANKTNNKGKKKKRKSNKLQAEKQSGNSEEVSPIIDMPIEPDEPTYCLCQQVSFGQMIACDNLECPIEWFHFTCVRLLNKPKGKWYCPDCVIKRKRDAKRDTR